MKKLLIIIDMQNDFISGALGSEEAAAIVPAVKAKLSAYKATGHTVIFTQDTHDENYLTLQEGSFLPVAHCVEGTYGHLITGELSTDGCEIVRKPAFGSLHLAEIAARGGYDEIELCGLCTDICVVSNALILKARLPETPVAVDAACCAGTSRKSHEAALTVMKMCHVNVF